MELLADTQILFGILVGVGFLAFVLYTGKRKGGKDD